VALVDGLGDDVDRVKNNEKLYRGVKREYWKRKKDGSGFRLSSQAFTDPKYRISVYRACLCGHNPSRAQKDDTYYVCSLLAGCVRSIGSVVKRDNDKVVQHYTIDVEPKPLAEEEDDSHAEIFATPEIFSPRVFNRLQEALAHPDRYEWEPEFGPSDREGD
jgi:hypothetical protein